MSIDVVIVQALFSQPYYWGVLGVASIGYLPEG